MKAAPFAYVRPGSVGDVVADDDLVLAAGLCHGHDTGSRLDGGGVGLRFVLQHEAQTCCAVHERTDVLFSADALEDAGRGLRVVHGDTLFLAASARQSRVAHASGLFPGNKKT